MYFSSPFDTEDGCTELEDGTWGPIHTTSSEPFQIEESAVVCKNETTVEEYTNDGSVDGEEESGTSCDPQNPDTWTCFTRNSEFPTSVALQNHLTQNQGLDIDTDNTNKAMGFNEVSTSSCKVKAETLPYRASSLGSVTSKKLDVKHNNIRVYLCNICQSKFKRRYNLEKHKKTHWSRTSLQQPKQLFKCGWCPHVFRVRSSLCRHIRHCHEEKKKDKLSFRTTLFI